MPTDRANLKAVTLRIREDACALIDKAASIQGRSRADFIIEAARRAAEGKDTVFNRPFGSQGLFARSASSQIL